MKYVLASIFALTLTTTAFADAITYKTVVTGFREHRENPKRCWQAHGNWVGGESYISCEFSSGEIFTKQVPVCDEKKS